MENESGKMMLQSFLVGHDLPEQIFFWHDHGEAFENKLKVSFRCIDICVIRYCADNAKKYNLVLYPKSTDQRDIRANPRQILNF